MRVRRGASRSVRFGDKRVAPAARPGLTADRSDLVCTAGPEQPTPQEWRYKPTLVRYDIGRPRLYESTMRAGDTTTIVTVDTGTTDFDRVLELHRAEKRWLGFLPDAGFADRASTGTLLAATQQDRVLAYVLYDLPGDWVKVVHLCVDPAARG
jgi:hypothetical protein